MFKKIVSKLSLSPSAVSELVFYARRLQQESVTRTFSAIAAVLIVLLQFATIIAPPTPTNAASPNDIIHGGFVSKSDLLNRYDGSSELKALFNRFGISRADISDATTSTINSKDHSLKSIGRTRHGSGDTEITVGSHTYWGRGLYVWDTGANVKNGSTYKVLKGTRSGDNGYFAIIFDCGNIVYKTLPTPQKPAATPKKSTPKPTTKPTPTATPKVSSPTIACVDLSGDVSDGESPLTVNFTGQGSATKQTITEYQFNFGDGKTANQVGARTAHQYTKAGTYTATLRVKGSTGTVSPSTPACSFTITVDSPPASFTKSKSALNTTQSIDATTKPAHAGDVIRYSLSTKNTGGTAQSYAVVEHIEDILEYADVTDTGGATVQDGVMTWPDSSIAPGSTLTKFFTVKIKDPIPATPTGLSDKFSYDLRLDNVYGNEVRITLEPPLAKQVEVASTSLPQTGPGASTFIILVVSFITIFFYLRNRQLMAEVKILRGTYQGGF